jgi:basic amino acid/polyamine antiporter, APA family
MSTASSSTASGEAAKPASLYTRQATGLVREISTSASIALNISFIAIALAVLVVTSQPLALPGSSPVLTMALALALSCLPALLYALFTIAMPRSGGEYVFAGRALHPWIGFFANFNICTWYVLSAANIIFLIPTFALSSTFATIGVTAHSHTLITWSADVTKHGWTFGIGVTCALLVALAVSIRMPHTLTIVKLLVVVSIVGVVLSIVILLVNSRSSFESEVVRYGGNYQQVISDAGKAGYPVGKGFSLWDSFRALPLAWLAVGFAIMTSYAGGEVRNVRRVAPLGAFGALAIGAALMLPLLALASSRFGNDFLGGSALLQATGSSHYPFQGPAFLFFFVSMLGNSSFLAVLIGISFVAAVFSPLVPIFIASTRSMFAWSFDRVLPRQLSEIDKRTRAPICATVVVLAALIGYLALLVWGSATFQTLLLAAGIGTAATFVVAGLAGMVFPYTRRDLYDASPIRRSVAGIPLITLAGAGTLVFAGFLLYCLISVDSLQANKQTGVIATLIVGGLGLIIWPISYLINRRRGVDLTLVAHELPPE